MKSDYGIRCSGQGAQGIAQSAEGMGERLSVSGIRLSAEKEKGYGIKFRV